jgi:hypothetical protein
MAVRRTERERRAAKTEISLESLVLPVDISVRGQDQMTSGFFAHQRSIIELKKMAGGSRHLRKRKAVGEWRSDCCE